MFPNGSGGGGGFNLLATFQQNQTKIISSVVSGVAAPNFANQLAPTPYTNSYIQPTSVSSSSPSQQSPFISKPRPATASVLQANPAAKAKSQPRPTVQTPQPRPIQATPSNHATYAAIATPAPSASTAAMNDYARDVLGVMIPTAVVTPAKQPIYSAPVPTPRLAPTSSAASSSTAPPTPSISHHTQTGPTTTVVRSTTNANISITKAPPPTYKELECEECGPSAEVILDPHQGVEVCTNCGLVLGTFISDESEWRTFSDRRGDDPNRVGGPEIGLLADAGLATLMGDNPNGVGTTLAKLQNKSALSSNHRQLLDAFKKCSRISSLLSLPQSFTDRANELYKKILESKTLRPRGSDTLIVTCLFMVCKAEHAPRTIKEMCGVSEVSQKDLGKCFKDIKRLQFHKHLKSARGGGHASDNDDDDEYKSYVARWGNQLRLTARLIEVAKTIAERARDILHRSRDPGTTCGAALYIASRCGTLEDRKTIESVSHAVNISIVSIKSEIQAILAQRNAILPAEFATTKIDI